MNKLNLHVFLAFVCLFWVTRISLNVSQVFHARQGDKQIYSCRYIIHILNIDFDTVLLFLICGKKEKYSA